jgi:hypothetical protein
MQGRAAREQPVDRLCLGSEQRPAATCVRMSIWSFKSDTAQQ